MLVQDLGTLSYRDAWAIQERVHEEVLAGEPERILLVEHFPVITLGRRPGGEKHLLVGTDELERLGVELVQSDRGGEITFHGPGQIVAYPIIRLADHGFSVSGYVHALEYAVIGAMKETGLVGVSDPSAIGVWVDEDGQLAKVCAIGVRIRRGISLHGLALNFDTDLENFDLIVPCGLHARPVTSLRRLLRENTPSAQTIKDLLVRHLKLQLVRDVVAEHLQ